VNLVTRLLVLTLLAASVGAAAPAANAAAVCWERHPDGSVHAHVVPSDPPCAPEHYFGGCGFNTFNDTLPGGQLGGNDTWSAQGYVVAPVNNSDDLAAAATVTASCELRINGWSQGTVVGPVTGPLAVAATETFQFSASIDAVISMCTHVTVGAHAEEVVCRDATTTPLVPQPVVDLLDQVFALLNEVFLPVDQAICPILGALAPGIYPVIVDPTGDVYLFSTEYYDRWYDCPPYGV
jgi:hypothetical protein